MRRFIQNGGEVRVRPFRHNRDPSDFPSSVNPDRLQRPPSSRHGESRKRLAYSRNAAHFIEGRTQLQRRIACLRRTPQQTVRKFPSDRPKSRHASSSRPTSPLPTFTWLYWITVASAVGSLMRRWSLN